ncbi:MAG TPA: TadE/TadG family type IV pilus assembly protein [Planctomycetia bacterium]|nr:TadE/TadG family type IV pilus assembly protein [Planctomycetia bacterium]
MLIRNRRSLSDRNRRRGASLVEFAVVAPIAFLLIIGFAVLASGVYRYQQNAYLAREGARYASVHGYSYRKAMGLSLGDAAVWTDDIKTNAVVPQARALDKTKLTVTASWLTGNNQANAGDPATGFTTTIKNAVTVTVSYQWFPEAFMVGPITLRSSTTLPLTY